jgi:ATP-dependent Clp protease ATP-binding subunit ClpA
MSEAQSVRVPVTAIRAQPQPGNPLSELEGYLRNVIFGQERAIESVVRALNRARYGFAAGRSGRPVVVLLFLGPTGGGKSETAKRLADYLHPEGGGFLKIDCSLFSHGHEIAALVGAPPAYVGRDQRPLFDPEIITTPNSVILFDEVEKASTEFWHLLLQIMEDGEVTLLNGGQRVDFSQSLILMTTNAGAREMGDFIHGRRLGFASPHDSVEKMGADIYSIGFQALQRVFAPEWLNRIDEVVAFRPLSCDTLERILDCMLADANASYRQQAIEVTLTPAAKELLLRKSFTPEFGARPVRARLLKDIDAPLADLLASGAIPPGSRVWVDVTGEETFGHDLAFYYEASEELRLAREQMALPRPLLRGKAGAASAQVGSRITSATPATTDTPMRKRRE